MRQLLLVTGSRVLADRPEAEEWSRAILRDAITSLSEKDIVFSGGADGPDTWAVNEADRRGLRYIEFKLDCGRYENGKHVGHWIDPIQQQVHAKHEWPLVRNRALVEAAAKASAAGWGIRVLALKASWATTSGTAHTVDLAKERITRELSVKVELCELPDADRLDVVWLDTETGGTSEKIHPVIEIGAVRVDPSNKRIIDQFETKLAVPAGMIVESQAAAVNGYSESAWTHAPQAKDALQKFLEWLPKRFTVAGYNLSFDMRFLKHSFWLHGIEEPGWTSKTIDPLVVVRSTLKKRGEIKSGKLDDVCDHFGIYNDTRHRALADAERARLVYLSLLGHEAEDSLFPNKGKAQ